MEVKIGDKIRNEFWNNGDYIIVEWIGVNEYAGINQDDKKHCYYINKDDLEHYVEPTRSFKETKVRVYNDELSKEVQEALFKLGYKLTSLAKKEYIGAMFLYIEEDNSITWGARKLYYNEVNFKEVQAHEILDEASKL